MEGGNRIVDHASALASMKQYPKDTIDLTEDQMDDEIIGAILATEIAQIQVPVPRDNNGNVDVKAADEVLAAFRKEHCDNESELKFDSFQDKDLSWCVRAKVKECIERRPGDAPPERGESVLTHASQANIDKDEEIFDIPTGRVIRPKTPSPDIREQRRAKRAKMTNFRGRHDHKLRDMIEWSLDSIDNYVQQYESIMSKDDLFVIDELFPVWRDMQEKEQSTLTDSSLEPE